MREDCGATQRTMHFVRFFERLGPVDLAYSHRRDDDPPHAPSRFEREIRLKQRPPSSHIGARVRRLMRLHRIPLPIDELTHASEALLLSAVTERQYDHIVVRDLYNTAPLLRLPRCYRERTIVDFADVLSGGLYDDRFGSVSAMHKRAIVALNRRYLRRYERRCLQYGAALFCSRRELRAVLHKDANAPVFVVPNIYSATVTEGYRPTDGADRGNVLFFVGALNYGPNVRGLKWFVESIFPAFERQYHDAQLIVAGKSPTPEVTALCRSRPWVELHPDTDALNTCYSRCRAVVVPLLAGGGTRIKILEAAVVGRPVLTTPVGAEGLDFIDQQHLLLFRDSPEFIRGYARLLDPAVYRAVTTNAEQRVRSRYSPDRFSRAMHEVMTRVA